RQYGRYGYRRITALHRAEGWPVNHNRVERIWRREGQKVPSRQPWRSRFWLNDGSCLRHHIRSDNGSKFTQRASDAGCKRSSMKS
ncbi:MAG: transposase, partial [Candidatus Marinimicrobia bacterium]|nr:transposase [Candidatus Neomarinimicrobiota bacterium]